jgi:hypothetical protein
MLAQSNIHDHLLKVDFPFLLGSAVKPIIEAIGHIPLDF